MTPSTTISKSGYQKKSLSVLMTQSTIYRQHEARLARSNRLKDDPRPPLIRVLSLLPGLHILVPRYEPHNNKDKKGEASATTTPSLSPSSTSLSLGAMYSEETKFIKDDEKDDDSSSVATLRFHPSSPPQHHLWMVPAAVLSTSVASAMAHVMFGKRQPLVLSNNPFQTVRSSTTSTRFLGASPTSLRPTVGTPLPMVMASTAALFGTRVYLEELETSEANHFFTSAMAGLASGMVSFLWLSTTTTVSSSSSAMMMSTAKATMGGGRVHRNGSWLSSSLLPYRYLGSHVLGGMLYFHSYEYIKKSLNGTTATNNNHTNPSLWSVALAGGVAGVLQAAVTTRLPMVCLRAAPTHALIWCAYEAATSTTTTTIPTGPTQTISTLSS